MEKKPIKAKEIEAVAILKKIAAELSGAAANAKTRNVAAFFAHAIDEAMKGRKAKNHGQYSIVLKSK